MSTIIGWREVLADPRGIVEHLLQAGIYGLTDVEVRLADHGCVILRLTLEPWADLAELQYPAEQVSIMVKRGGRVAAVPLADDRRWLHRLPPPLGELCLWYPGDPRGLRWEWDDGLVAYVTIVHRHLQAEECWRRHGVWPAEDAPHGAGQHPIRTLALRWVADREAQ